jgi:hypothetical protein
MGTWGIKTFDNDGNSDWLWDLEETDDASLLEESLAPRSEDYLEAPDGEVILAAAEIINGIKNGPREGLPDEALDWITAHKNLDVSKLLPKAIRMIDRLLGEKSELKELWQENKEDFPLWLADVNDLKNQLSS